MIDVYKMGMSYYEGKGVDSNSGLSELQMIKFEVDSMNKSFMLDEQLCGFKVLIVVNGLRDEADDEFFEKHLDEYDLKIFIMSDAIAIKTSIDLINKCDFLFHQVPDDSFKFCEVHCEQMYGYVPELFYKYIMHAAKIGFINTSKVNGTKVFFGGNNTGRDDKFFAYNVYESDCIAKRLKVDGMKDERVGHAQYIAELAKYKYSLVICRKEYREHGWLTSRLFESVALDCLPIIDYEYDKCGLLGMSNCIARVIDEASMIEAVEFYEQNDMDREKLLLELNRLCESRSEMFSMTVKQIVSHFSKRS